MHTQEEREEQTLAIATALGLFVLLLVIAGGLLWIASLAVDVSDDLARPILATAVCLAGAMAIANLVRATKR
jgi:hypothetical protein